MYAYLADFDYIYKLLPIGVVFTLTIKVLCKIKIHKMTIIILVMDYKW